MNVVLRESADDGHVFHRQQNHRAIERLRRISVSFPERSMEGSLRFAEQILPYVIIPKGFSWYVMPKRSFFSPDNLTAEEHVLTRLAATRTCWDWRRENPKVVKDLQLEFTLHQDRPCPTETFLHTRDAISHLEKLQEGCDFIFFPAQFGHKYEKLPPQKTQEIIEGTAEFGLSTFCFLSMLLAEPRLFAKKSDIPISCPGDLCAISFVRQAADGRDANRVEFNLTPTVSCENDGEIGVDAEYAHVSGFSRPATGSVFKLV